MKNEESSGTAGASLQGEKSLESLEGEEAARPATETRVAFQVCFISYPSASVIGVER